MMPVLPIEDMVADCTDYHASLVRAAINRASGRLRATKPFRTIDTTGDDAYFKACANYVWRMLCFDYAGIRPHNSMPVTADFDIYNVCKAQPVNPTSTDYHDSARDMVRRMDDLVKRVEALLPITSQKGVMQWLPLYANYTG